MYCKDNSLVYLPLFEGCPKGWVTFEIDKECPLTLTLSLIGESEITVHCRDRSRPVLTLE